MFEPDDLLLALAGAGVEFVVIGGVAVGVHGFIRATKDLDIVPAPQSENLERLARLLVEIQAQQAGVGEFSPDEFPYDPTDPVHLGEGANFRLETSLGPMDILQWVEGVDSELAYTQLAPHALSVTFRGNEIRVCSLAHLRAMKRAAGRQQDLDDLKQLESVTLQG
jgi:predicted nucleotidyltransferase